jgi:hypothetical protein
MLKIKGSRYGYLIKISNIEAVEIDSYNDHPKKEDPIFNVYVHIKDERYLLEKNLTLKEEEKNPNPSNPPPPHPIPSHPPPPTSDHCRSRVCVHTHAARALVAAVTAAVATAAAAAAVAAGALLVDER